MKHVGSTQPQQESSADADGQRQCLRGCSLSSSLHMLTHRASCSSFLGEPPRGYSMDILASIERQCSVALENHESHSKNDRERSERCNDRCSKFWLADSCRKVCIVSRKFVLCRSRFNAEDRSRSAPPHPIERPMRITNGSKRRVAIHIEVNVSC